MTVRELLTRIDSRELSEWMAYYEVEPWGAEPADYRTGIVASTVANTARDPKQKKDPFLPKDFIPRYGLPPEAEPQTVEEQSKIMRLWAPVVGGKKD